MSHVYLLMFFGEHKGMHELNFGGSKVHSVPPVVLRARPVVPRRLLESEYKRHNEISRCVLPLPHVPAPKFRLRQFLILRFLTGSLRLLQRLC